MTVQQEVMALVGTAELALFNGNIECGDLNYQRAAIGGWVSKGKHEATCTVRYGPFFAWSTFDRVAVMRDDRMIEAVPLPSRVEVTKGRLFEYEFTIST